MQPLVSICMPAYNAGAFIAEAVQSVIDQTYNNWELIIVNDGSTDDTQSIITRFEKDERIKSLVTTNGGAARARNIAFSHSNGDYIIFFDADDLLSPNFLQTQLTKALASPDLLVLADWGRFYNNEPITAIVEQVFYDELRFDEWICDYWYNCNPMTNPGRAFIPKTLIEKGGIWNERLSLNDDLEFFTRIMLHTEKIVFNHEGILSYRSGILGISSLKGKTAFESSFTAIELSVKMALAQYSDREIIRQSCANIWQNLIYEIYPEYPDLVKKAELSLAGLPVPTLPYPSGGITKVLARFFNWKTVKLIKKQLQPIKIH